ncbi:MAG: hypothetical protein COZ80_00620 [Ignavibacteria bacterium CG_4_8_14_3_um_filter_37_9]|nr:tetratricopeptide repeat protein [Ignavibacteria bacterium]OIO23251.1 MAG: hypothetical protein AUJ54_02050 [Ignavibacteria bacterium CG1_02_37_35]PIS45358.1 MAG: hypothetical protein COT22_05660 [Ignavibacteria bacterium CG08_land_8_20_14_0_20_37_9]PIX00362.1 MAG: hypothetical protein COZ80_00620 [Ignavibacteria bacterium CG_4_8_14_3_um_filter_37_9]PIX94443.1 MAG: hypothetical protein COZ25_05495 [Ignavibacteria bacterium CG_4_10_14_3_um_filter_37_18]PJC57666.1 MAG: hypothetical protein CO
MLNCPSCHANIEEKFKFCPNCGTPFEILKTDEKVESTSEQIICSACGEENERDASFCVSCGVNLGNEKTEVRKTVRVISEPTSSATPQIKTQKRGDYQTRKHPINSKKVKQEYSQKNSKPKNSQDFDTKKIALVFSGILIFALVILFFSGVFDEPKISSENLPGGNLQQNSGIDLASIAKINQLDAQLKAEPENFNLVIQLAHLRNDSGFKEEAIKLYTKYLEKFPQSPDVLVDMGVCYFELQNYDKAIPAMENAIKINPRHQIAHMNLGIVNLAKGNIEKSKEWLQKAVDLDPNSEIGRKAKELLTSH